MKNTIQILEGVEKTLGEIASGTKFDDKLRRNLYNILNEVKKARETAHLEAGTSSVKKIPHVIETDPSSMRTKETSETHESFGVVSLTRPTGGMTRLFGSMVDALPSYVELKIQRAVRNNDSESHHEHIRHDFGQPVVAVIAMSNYQWAELITNMNGVDVPCTVKTVNGVCMDELPDEVISPLEQIKQDTKKEFFHAPINTEVEFKAALKALTEKVNALGLSAKKTAAINDAIAKLHNFVTAPMAAATWATQVLAENTEKLTSQARVEIAAAFESIVRKTGYQALVDKGLVSEFMLTDGKDKK